MARRWSGVRRVADVRCGMRVTPAPHMRVTHRCAAAEGSAGEGGFFSTHNEGDRCLHTRSYTRERRSLTRRRRPRRRAPIVVVRRVRRPGRTAERRPTSSSRSASLLLCLSPRRLP